MQSLNKECLYKVTAGWYTVLIYLVLCMRLDDALLREILLKEDYITEADAKEADLYVKEQQGSFVDYLLQKNLISERLLGQSVAEYLQLPYADLEAHKPSLELMQKLPAHITQRYHATLISMDDKTLTLATDNPEDPYLLEDVQTLFPDKTVQVHFALPRALDELFALFQRPLGERLKEVIATDINLAPAILEEVFDDAFVLHASDIHFEPRAVDVIIRFRIDGVMHVQAHIPKENYETIINRVKVQSGLRIDEHFAAQDGSMRHRKESRVIDMRTSIVPTVDGEKMVLRVLAAYVQELSLGNIGVSATNQKVLDEAINKPFGMILVVGPTGSGKSTTLYAVLKQLNKPDINITTIEDPVEYKIAGINQIQVNADTNLTFAQGLRSIVRQDPDVILVGEIRDQETAEIAVNAALTGHMLFSTFHANDAATALPRLLDMGVEPFLLASTLELVMGQRLVRRICDQCRYSIHKPSTELPPELAPYFPEGMLTLYDGKKCQACGFTGYKGRTAIFECIRITGQMEELILKQPSTQEIWTLARQQGARPLFEDGVEKVLSGVTSLEELLRVAEPNSD